MPEQFTDAKRKLLERFLRGEAARQSREFAIPARVAGEPIPLAPVQQHLLLHAQMAPDSALYTESVTVYFRGELDRPAFERAFHEIVRRHEIWRTGFASVDGETVQAVYPDYQIPIPFSDLTRLPETGRETEALRLATADVQRLMDPAVGPLLRPRLVKLGAQDYRCYLAIHHLIHDGVTIYGVFFPELVALYNAFSQGQPSPLAEPQLQYADYALWLKRLLDNDVASRQLEYWRRQLSGSLPQLRLPSDWSRPPLAAHRGAIERFVLPPELTKQLRQLSRDEGVTLYMLLLAALQALLFRYSGEEDLIVGTLTDNRRRTEFQQLMGYFLNTLPLRTRPSGAMGFRQYLAEVKDAVLGSFAHSEIPFDRLVREVQPKRDPSRHPLFQVMFVMEPPPPPVEDPHWDLKQGEVSNGAAKFDLLFDVEERTEGLALRIHYDADLFKPATIQRIAGHWQSLLQGVVQDAGTRLAELPLLTAAETRLLTTEWNGVSRPTPVTTIHEMFEDRAARSPNATALECDRMRLSYSQLNRRANRLARRLQEEGAAPDRVIALCLERSSEMAVAVLAILKSGGAYLPLDASLPEQRMRTILEDSQAPILVTERSLESKLSHLPGRRVFVDEGTGSSGNLGPVAGPRNLAYVIYTSGSTGRPNGVQIEHRSLAAYIDALRNVHAVTRADRLLSVTALSFDIATMDLFLALVNGAQLVIATSAEARDPAHLRTRIEEVAPTVMNATPATWHALVEAGWQGDPELRIMSGGDKLLPELARQLMARCAVLWNGYGPTETTIGSAFHQVTSADGPIPIGKPIANTRFLILDKHRQLVPAGVSGELYIGGAGLARGYGREGLTRERFVELPSYGRFYRSGDRARWLPDGTVECLGRADNQIKIRGFRVEIEEIEAVLAQHPEVRGAAVKAWPDSSGHASLTAYVVAAGRPDLRAFLHTRLPAYMVPARVIWMEALPLTTGGKLDRMSLPEPIAEDRPASGRFPEDTRQRRLIAIWESVLEHKGIGIEDNFFDLGGHSLLVARLLRQVEAEFGVRRSMADLFQAPTIEQFSLLLDADDEIARSRKIVPIQSAGSNTPLFWINAGPKLRPLVARLGIQRPFLGVSLSAQEQAMLPEVPSVEEMAVHLVGAIREVQPEGPYLLGGWCASGLLAYEAAVQLQAQGQEVAALFLLDSFNPEHYLAIPKRRVLMSRIRFHARQLLRGSSRDRAGYIWARIKSRTAGLRRSAESASDVGDIKLYRATRRYRPPAFPGRLILLQPAQGLDVGDLERNWSSVGAGSREVYKVAGNHETALDEPFVSDLSGRMSMCLAQAESALSRINRSPAQRLFKVVSSAFGGKSAR